MEKYKRNQKVVHDQGKYYKQEMKGHQPHNQIQKVFKSFYLYKV